jgi:hypothetical protein
LEKTKKASTQREELKTQTTEGREGTKELKKKKRPTMRVGLYCFENNVR